jgi:hypothetical protein
MRRRWALVLGLLTGSLVGCLTGESARPITWLDRFHSCQGPCGADVVRLDVALLECPVGDRYINEGLWKVADEQVIDLERKAVLEDNGFRVGLIGGLLPEGLQDLLKSERSCASMRRNQLHADNPTSVVLGSPVADCRFEIHQDRKVVPVVLKGAECTLQIVPSLARDGSTRLHFTPQIRHGDKKPSLHPGPDHATIVMEQQQPTEDYRVLSWDVTLAPNQYVVVGTRFDRRGTLGYQYFFRGDEPRPVQRLLVIFPGRMGQGLETEIASGLGEDEASFRRSPPLAVQASWTTARGSGP